MFNGLEITDVQGTRIEFLVVPKPGGCLTRYKIWIRGERVEVERLNEVKAEWERQPDCTTGSLSAILPQDFEKEWTYYMFMVAVNFWKAGFTKGKG